MDIFKKVQDLSAIYDDDGPRAMIPESRPMFNDGGMLVQPSDDGSRPGYAKNKMSGSKEQQAGNLAKKENRLSKIGELFINKDYKKLKVKTRKARMGKGSIDAGGVLNSQDKTMLNKIIYDGTVKEQNALAKELGINRRYMIEVYTEAEKLKDEGKALQQSKAKLIQVQNQKKIFDEILNNKNATIKSMAKKFKMTEKEITKESSKLLKNVYAQNVAIGKGPEFDIDSRGNKTLKSWLPDNFETTDSFLDNFANIKGLKNVQSENMSILIRNAYGNDPKKFTAAMKGLSEYNKLVNALPEGIKLDLDHPLSKSFLKGSGASAQELLYVTPISREYNRGFKQSLSMAYDKALLNPNRDKKLIKTIENFANTIGVNIGKGSTKKLDFGTTPITKKTQSGLASELVKNFKEQEMAKKNLANFRKTKEGQNIIKQIFPSGRAELNIPKTPLNAKLEKQIKVLFCGNKDGNVPGSCDISEAMDNMIKQTNAVKQGVIKGPEATRVANKAAKVARFGTGRALAKVLGPIGLAGEAVFEVAMAAPGYARGESGKRLLGDSILGLIPGVGQSSEEEFAEYATKDGMSQLDQQKIKDVNRFLELNDALPLAYKNITKGGRGDPSKGAKTFNKLYNEFSPLYNQFVGGPPSESASTAFAEQQRINDLINADKAIRAKQRDTAMDQDFMAAGGGIAKMAGDRSGPPPQSGPNSQGLQGLFNRVKKV